MKKIIITMTILSLTTASLMGCNSDEKAQVKSSSVKTSAVEEDCCGNENGESKDVRFKYYKAEQLKESIEKNSNINLLDIQVKKDWNKHHIKGALETNAYPVKTEEDKQKLDSVIPSLKENKDPIVIVCPGGAGGAERTQDYLIENQIEKDRIYILEDGQSKWPYDELLEK